MCWYGRFNAVGLVSGDAHAFVMPVRCCAHGQDRGRYWMLGRERVCLCRDCVAGRLWGWL